jgi:hypothetical protein
MKSKYAAGFVEFTKKLTKNGKVFAAFQIEKSEKASAVSNMKSCIFTAEDAKVAEKFF